MWEIRAARFPVTARHATRRVAPVRRGPGDDGRIVLAVASGAIASGAGYGIWYAVVPSLGATRAAAVQLAVPVVAGVGATLLLGERLGSRIAVAGLAIIAGIALTLYRSPPPAASPRTRSSLIPRLAQRSGPNADCRRRRRRRACWALVLRGLRPWGRRSS
jgi:EamA-like transporter family